MSYFDSIGNVLFEKGKRNENYPLFRVYLDLWSYLMGKDYLPGWDTCSLEWFWNAGKKVYWQSYPKERGKHMSWENMLGVYMHHKLHNIPNGYLPVFFWNDGLGTNHYAWMIFLSFKNIVFKWLFYWPIFFFAWFSLIHKLRPPDETTGRIRWFTVLNILYGPEHPLIMKTKNLYMDYRIFMLSFKHYITVNKTGNFDQPILLEMALYEELL